MNTPKGINFQKLIIGENQTFRDAVKVINDNLDYGLAIITNDDDRFVGIITRGDVYQKIISGENLDSLVKDICNKNPVIILEKDFSDLMIIHNAIKEILSRKSLFIPILDNNLKLINLLHYNELEINIWNSTKIVPRKGNVLVLGGAGYLGIVLLEKLVSSGYAVSVLDNFMHANYAIYDTEYHEELKIVKGDIQDIEILTSSLEGVDVVINLVSFESNLAQEKSLELNFIAFNAIVESAKFFQIGRFLTVSMPDRLSDQMKNKMVKEVVHDNLRKTDSVEREDQLLKSKSDYLTVLKFENLYGLSPRMRFDLPVNKIVLEAISEDNNHLGSDEQIQNLMHVEKAAQAFIKALDLPVEDIEGKEIEIDPEFKSVSSASITEVVKEIRPGIVIGQSGDQVKKESSESIISDEILIHGMKKSIEEIIQFITSSKEENFNSPQYKTMF